HHAEESQGPLSTEQRSLLAEMIADHLKVIESDAARLEAELAPIFPRTMTDEGGEESGAWDSTGAIDRLYELVLSNENAISASFTISPGGGPVCPIKTAHFWRSLRSEMMMAASMRKTGGWKK